MVKKIAGNVLNGLIFYGVWFVCVYDGASGGLHYIPITLAALIFHFAVTPQKVKDLVMLVIVVMIGGMLDTLYQTLGLLQFTTPNPLVPWMAPFWVLGIYALLAVSIDHALRWLKLHMLVAAIFGGGGGAISYAFGERIGAVTYLTDWFTMSAIIAVVWFFLFPIFCQCSFYLNKRFPHLVR